MSPETVSQIARLRELYRERTGRELIDNQDLVSEAVRRLDEPEDIIQFRDEYRLHLEYSSDALIREAVGYHTVWDISLAVSALKDVNPKYCDLWQETLNVPDFTKGLEPPKRPDSLR